MEIPFDEFIPKPIGEFFFHRYLRQGRFYEHHESLWVARNGKTISVCNDCGRKALFIDIPISRIVCDCEVCMAKVKDKVEASCEQKTTF